MEKDGEMHDTMIAVDLAKRVFHLHVASMTGHLKERKKLTPLQFRRYMADARNVVWCLRRVEARITGRVR